MARLDGSKTNIGPYIAGFLVLAVLAAGAFYYFKSNSGQPGTAQQTSVTASNNLTATSSGNETNASEGIPDAQGINAASPEASPTDGALSSGATPGDATPSGATPNDTPAVSDATPPVPIGEAGAVNSASATPASNSSNSLATDPTSGAASAAASGNTALGSQTASGVVAKRSKTITNRKTGTTVTYSKEVHKDGSVTHGKKTGTAPVRP